MPNPKTQATPGPDPQLELAILADAIGAMQKRLLEAGSWETRHALDRIRPIALAAPQMREALETLTLECSRILQGGRAIWEPFNRACEQARAALRAAGGEE